MFKGCCAYCEGKYTGTSYPQIEHFRPKSLFPELMFDYNNMNLSCQICNNIKQNKFDEMLVNPTEEEPNNHLGYKAYMLSPLNERGEFTIKLLELNSNIRVNARKKGYTKINDRLCFLQEQLENIDFNDKEKVGLLKMFIEITIKEIEKMFEDGFEFSSMYVWNFKPIIDELKKNI